MAVRTFFADRKYQVDKDLSMRKNIILQMLFIIPTFFAAADDTIVPFDKRLAVNVSGKYAITSFRQEHSAQYTSDRPWALGLGIRHKNTSIGIFLPSSYVFDEQPFGSFDIQLASYYDFIYYEAFCKRHQGFTDGDTENKSVDLSVFSSGISVGWLQNGKRHSLSAVYNLDCKQLSPSRSLIFGFGAFYTSIFSDDKNIKRYNNNRHFICFGPSIGYSYNVPAVYEVLAARISKCAAFAGWTKCAGATAWE
jgi:hypothetical protein